MHTNSFLSFLVLSLSNSTKRKKTFQRIFSYNSGCKKKVVKDFLASSSSLKTSKHHEAGLRHKLIISFKLEDSGFLETL